jgi:hypothetical protein
LKEFGEKSIQIFFCKSIFFSSLLLGNLRFTNICHPIQIVITHTEGSRAKRFLSQDSHKNTRLFLSLSLFFFFFSARKILKKINLFFDSQLKSLQENAAAFCLDFLHLAM